MSAPETIATIARHDNAPSFTGQIPATLTSLSAGMCLREYEVQAMMLCYIM